MAVSKSIRFSEGPALVQEFPRMTWEELDLAFYTDDEIGDMRQFAFMLECGLEEEDWTGPDVEALPWPKKEDIGRSQEQQERTNPSHWDDPAEDSDLEEEDLKGPASPKPPSSPGNSLMMQVMQRSMSMDMNWADSEYDESKSPIPNKPRSQRSSVEPTMAALLVDLGVETDDKQDENRTNISVPLARMEKPKDKKQISPKTPLLEKPKLKFTKSADLENMRGDDDLQRSPRMLMRTHSGSRRKIFKEKDSPYRSEKRRMIKSSMASLSPKGSSLEPQQQKNSPSASLIKPKADLESKKVNDTDESPKRPKLPRANTGSRRQKKDMKEDSPPSIEKRRMEKGSLKKGISFSSSSLDDSFLSGLNLTSNGSDTSIDTNSDSDSDSDIDYDTDDEIKMEFFRYMDHQPNRKSGVKAYTLYRAGRDPLGHYVGTALVIS
jgi:hypothetical protein